MPKKKDQQAVQETTEAKQPEAKFTRDDLARLVNEQVSKKLDENNQQWQSKFDEAVKQAKQDGLEEAKMNKEQLAQKEAQRQEEKFKKREAELNSKMAELNRREQIAHTKDLLSEQGLPTTGAEMLLGKTEEETKANIAYFKELVSQGVRNELHKGSAGKTPQTGAPAPTQAPSKDLADMNFEEMQAYLQSQGQI